MPSIARIAFPFRPKVPQSMAAQQAVDQLLNELPALWFVGVTNCATGELIAGHAPDNYLPAAAAARYHANLVQFQQQVLVQDQSFTSNEISLIMTTQWHLVRVVGQGKHLLSLIADTRSVSMSRARVALCRVAELLP